ncbi:MAG TPA: hypothetical protein VKK79_17210, partial [Candidatus Lokiarchaeia archaeon]|nr:hypothetical protein [Candidatus Lokiarchaeia archaeon]
MKVDPEKIAKHLSAFYTKPPNAHLLALCTMQFPNPAWDHLSGDLDSWRDFYVVDFACGSGTLLVALYVAMKNLYLEKCTKYATRADVKRFHAAFVENFCHGFDVDQAAIDATLENITLLESPAKFNRTHLLVMPLQSQPNPRLGSLDFLKNLWNETAEIPLPSFQVVIINPPFARSCGDNLLFGHLAKQDRLELTAELKRIRHIIGTTGIGQAGQAADFIYLAQKATAPGGRFSFIVPKSLCFGPSWEALRLFLVKNVELECIFLNYEEPHYGFSENTQLSECMVIARNALPDAGTAGNSSQRVLIVNFLTSPATEEEARQITFQICDAKNQILREDLTENISNEISVSADLFNTEGILCGNCYSVSQEILGIYVNNWAQIIGFYSPALCQIYLSLLHKGEFMLPENKVAIEIPLIPLRQLGTLGYDRKIIHQQTEEGQGPPTVSTFWGRDNSEITAIAVNPTGCRQPKASGSSNAFKKLQASASKFLIPETIWLEKTKCFFLFCSQDVISNVFWSFSPTHDLCSADGTPISPEEASKILALWGNSTLGILLFLGMRQETRGGWIHWKKR